MPNDYRLNKQIIKAIERCLNNGSVAEIKIEHAQPIVIEVKRRLILKTESSNSSGNDREEAQRSR
jgi:hypothetical protein